MKLILAQFILFAHLYGYTQLNQYGKSIEVNTATGLLIPHKKSMRHLSNDPSVKVEVGILFKTNGSKQHHHLYKLPSFGFVYGFSNSGNYRYIGNIQYLTAFTLIPFSVSPNAITLRVGAGLGYIQKPFDKYLNNKEIAIGSHLNYNFQVRVEKTFSVAKKSNVLIGLGLSHFSNASFTQPNLGLNYAHFYMGYKYSIKTPDLDKINEDTILLLAPSQHFAFKVGYALKETSVNSSKTGITSIGIEYIKHFSYKHGLIASLDLFHNGESKSINNTPFQLGLFVGYQKKFGSFSAGIGLAPYLYGAIQTKGSLYFKVYVEKEFGKRFTLQWLMRTHRTVADFAGLNVRYIICSKS